MEKGECRCPTAFIRDAISNGTFADQARQQAYAGGAPLVEGHADFRRKPENAKRDGPGIERFVAGKVLDPCPYRKSNPNVLVMESAKQWNGLDAPDRLHCPADGRILAQR